MTADQIYSQIRNVIGRAIAAGVSDHQNYPAIKDVGNGLREVYIQGAPDLSASMRDRPYDEIYSELEAGGAYHIKMIDGALIQMLYRFRRRSISSHRLSVFPSPQLDKYDDQPEIYESDEIFADVIGRFATRVPLRFDFSSSNDDHVDVDHPKSHLTLGGYKGCRIPVSGPLTPFQFMRFVLRHFYNPAYYRINLDNDAIRPRFQDTISDLERRIGFLTP